MGYNLILVEEKEDYAVITLNRPDRRNALNPEIVSEIGQAVEELLPKENLRSLMITGSGDKAFSAGADLASGFSGDVGGLIDSFHQTLSKIENGPKPVVAAINGHAFGGGCELSMACHFRLIQKGARIGLTESTLGIIPGAGGTQRMPRLIGVAKALDYMIFGKQLEAEEALRVGLVHQVVDDAKAAGEELCRKLAERAPVATRCILEAVIQGVQVPMEQALKIEKERFLQVVKTSDAAEGIQAFFQKRKPQFKGR